MTWLTKILPIVQRYNKYYQEERIDPVRAVAILSLFHIVFAFWFWVITDRAIPEYIYYSFSTIVLGLMGFDSWKSNTITINNMKGSNPDIDNPDL